MTDHTSARPRLLGARTLLAAAILLAGCAGQTAPAKPIARAETGHAVTTSSRLISFNTGTPGTIASTRPITGLESGERILGIDVRPANGALYALGSSGRLYTIDPATGAAKQVGTGTFAVALAGAEFGFDFNPVVDRIRVVSDTGQNLRLHPDTGAVVDADANTAGVQVDGGLAFATGDVNAGKRPAVVGAAYTHGAGAKATTNFAIDGATGALVTQGTREGAATPVSPNTGQLFTVGALGVPASGAVGFDIDVRTGAAFAAIGNTLYVIDLATGKAAPLGAIGGGEAIRALAITS